MIKVLLADDHAILRGGVKEILVRNIEDVECGEAGNAEQVLAQVREYHWHLLILGITMPGRSGLAILADLKALRPELPVLILSMLPEEQFGAQAFRAGAQGYMEKKSAPDELIQAVRRILAGGRYVSPKLAEKFARDLQEDADRSRHEALSPREFEILVLIGSGQTVGQIAEKLHLRGTTVSTYRARIMEKMKMTTTGDLIRYALQNHLVN